MINLINFLEPQYTLSQWIEKKYVDKKIEHLELAGVTNLLKVYRLSLRKKDKRYYQLCERLAELGFPQEAELISKNTVVSPPIIRSWEKGYEEYEIIFDNRMNEKPWVSVIISYYNDGISSVINGIKTYLNQTLYKQNLCEFIIVDSASPQNEYKEIKNRFGSMSNIILIRTRERERLYKAWNRGGLVARADALNFTSINDFIIDEGLELMYHYMQEKGNADWLQCNIGDEKGDLLLDCEANNFKKEMLFSSGNMTFSAQLVKKDAFIDIGGFDPTYIAAGDTDFKMRISRKHKICFLKRTVGKIVVSTEDVKRLTVNPRAEIEDFRAWEIYRRDVINLSNEEILDIGFSALKYKHPNIIVNYFSDPFFAYFCFCELIKRGDRTKEVLINKNGLEEYIRLYKKIEKISFCGDKFLKNKYFKQMEYISRTGIVNEKSENLELLNKKGATAYWGNIW